MRIIEALLLTTLLLTCGYVSYTDFKCGIIENRVLLAAGIVCGTLNAVYYTVFAKDYVGAFLIDFVLLVALSVGMYALNLWAAGDSKLLFLVVFAIPGRLYDAGGGAAPAIYIIVFTFSISFIYVIAESIALSIRRRERLQLLSLEAAVNFVRSYISIVVYILAVNYLIAMASPAFSARNASLIAMLDLFLSIIIHKYPVFFRLPTICAAAAVALGMIVAQGLRTGFELPDLRIYLYIAIVVLLRTASERYNYQDIPTQAVKPGMILSLSTVISMAPSRVAGLPRTTTEDMRSRLSLEEAEAVVRWGTSKYGSGTITIVRKMPFAVFITLGALAFIIFRLGGA